MTVEEVLHTLESLGSEQTRKTYMRHGVKDPLYGVSYANLNALVKKLKINHNLAVSLWASGNHEARMVAVRIADPQQATALMLESWLADLKDYVTTDGLSGYAGKTSVARDQMAAWMHSSIDWTSTVGWNVLSALAMNDSALPDAYFELYISTVERDIQQSQNRTRHAMNNALITIGMRNDALLTKVTDAAKRIGKVTVDHGDTNCVTPDAIAYIKKANARKAEKAKA